MILLVWSLARIARTAVIRAAVAAVVITVMKFDLALPKVLLGATVLDNILEQHFELLMERLTAKDGRNRHIGRVLDEGHTEPDPRRHLCIVRRGRVLPELNGLLAARLKVLEIQLEVPVPARIHDVTELMEGPAPRQLFMALSFGSVRAEDGISVGLAVLQGVRTVGATGGRHEGVHDGLVLDKVLTDLDELRNIQG